MATNDSTGFTFSDAQTDRLVTVLKRAGLTDLDNAILGKRMTDFERGLMCDAHAMLNGDTEAADRWLCDAVDLFGYDLTEQELKLLRLVDVIAETV